MAFQSIVNTGIRIKYFFSFHRQKKILRANRMSFQAEQISIAFLFDVFFRVRKIFSPYLVPVQIGRSGRSSVAFLFLFHARISITFF